MVAVALGTGMGAVAAAQTRVPSSDSPPIVIPRMAPSAEGGASGLDPQDRTVRDRRSAAVARAALYTQQAQRALQQGRLIEAADLLHSAVTSNPDDGGAREVLGETYLRLDRFLEAIPHLQRALQGLDPAPPHLLKLLALAFANVGDSRSARAALAAAGVAEHELPRALERLRRLPGDRDRGPLLARIAGL